MVSIGAGRRSNSKLLTNSGQRQMNVITLETPSRVAFLGRFQLDCMDGGVAWDEEAKEVVPSGCWMSSLMLFVDGST